MGDHFKSFFVIYRISAMPGMGQSISAQITRIRFWLSMAIQGVIESAGLEDRLIWPNRKEDNSKKERKL
jgi:hypothetical protein